MMFLSTYPKIKTQAYILTDTREEKYSEIQLLPVWKWMLTPTKQGNK